MTQGNEFKVIESQEQLDSIIKGRLDRNDEKHESEKKELRSEIQSLKEQVSNLTDASDQKEAKIEELNSQLSDRDNELEDFRVKEMRNDLAYEHGIPRNFSDRLKGSTREEIEADAKDMAETFRNMRPDPPTKDNEPIVYQGLDASYANMADNLAKGD